MLNLCISAFKKPPKRPKIKKTQEILGETGNDEHNVMPTPPQSKRQKKKLKKLQNSVRSKDKEIEKTILYLNNWDTNRSEWKYEKLRQIYIQKNVFDESVISEEHSDIAIRYLATSQGKARSTIVESAEKVMKEIEEKIEEKSNKDDDDDDEDEDNEKSESEDLTSSVRYKRAREVIQLMQE